MPRRLELKKGTPIEFMIMLLSRLGVLDEYKDCLQQAFDFYENLYNDDVPEKEILGRFIYWKEELPARLMKFKHCEKEAGELTVSLLRDISDKAKKGM